MSSGLATMHSTNTINKILLQLSRRANILSFSALYTTHYYLLLSQRGITVFDHQCRFKLFQVLQSILLTLSKTFISRFNRLTHNTTVFIVKRYCHW